MLVELAIGDAYGAGFEYVDYEVILAKNNLTGYYRHPRHSIEPGNYTDDTQMSIAIAETIVSGQAWTQELLAAKFVEAFKRDPHSGYAGGFYQFLQNVRNGAEFLAQIKGDSDKSGAAMRAGPLGVFPTTSAVIEKCTLQAAITHNSPDGINAAVAAALMTHYFLYKLGPKKELGHFLKQYVAGNWTNQWQGDVGSKGWMSVQAAITALQSSDKMRSLLQKCVAYGGDVDTVATIALAAGACSSEIEQDLPDVLYKNLENNLYGRDYLEKLDQKLLALVQPA